MFATGTGASCATLELTMAELIRNIEVIKKIQDEMGGITNGKRMVKGKELHGMSYLKIFVRQSIENCQIQDYDIFEGLIDWGKLNYKTI